MSGDKSGNLPKVLFILTLPPEVRQQYMDGLAETLPELHVDMVDDPAAAEPYLPDADVLIAFGPQLGKLAAPIFEGAENLKWVQALGTGVDNIADVPTLRDDVIVTNMHGIHGPPVSEAAIAQMLALSRHLPFYVKNQETGSWTRRAPTLLYEKTAGIFGIGAIAEALAPRLKALGMTVIGISSSVRDVAGFDAMFPRDRIVEAVADLDYLVLLTPLTEETRNFVGAEVFRAMKPSAFLINLARGGVVDEDALIAALNRKQIAAAALDVFLTEPLPADHPFWSMDNVVVTPHTGGFNDTYPKHALPIIIENLRRFIAGERRDLINFVAR